MRLRILSGADARQCIDMPTAIEAMRGAFAALASGDADVPLRVALETDHGVSLFMPAHVSAPRHAGRAGGVGHAGAKVVSVNPGNAAADLPAIHAVILVVDPVTGRPTALMEGGWLTALRTGAVGGLAADLLAREDARSVALFGAGVQARTQLEAVRCVRDIGEVRIFTPSGVSASTLADELVGVDARRVDSPSEALAGADIVVVATDSAVPVFDGALVERGSHVTGVGSYTTEMREVDTTLVSRARVIVDQREAIMEEAGDIVGPIRDGALDATCIAGEIGEVVIGSVPGRTALEEITFFKSVGNAVQDVAVAAHVLERAEHADLGVVVDL